MAGRAASLGRLIDHAAWANKRVADALAACEGADAQALAWFAHVVTTERLYFERLSGADPFPQDFWPSLTLAECRDVAEKTARRYRDYLADAADATLAIHASYRDSSGRRHRTPVEELIEHVALHGSHHRGQISARLRALGNEPPVVDLIYFLRERAVR